MKNSKQKRPQALVQHRASFKLLPVATGCAALMMLSSGVYAQQVDSASRAAATEATLGAVTVTGIRAAVESAIAVKKGADTIVEAISNEDLGKLPDPSVADSLARLPGVSAQRNRGTGKAQAISVRGMSPDFNGATMNGREQASAGDSRGVDFDLFPGELLSGVLVYKTPHAGLVGQGLSSTIDLRTVRPLDYKTRALAVNIRNLRSGIENGVPDGEGTGQRASFSYVDQFADRRIGVALGFVQFKDTGASQLATNDWGNWNPELDYNGGKAKVPGGFGYDQNQSTQNRKGLMAVLQFKPFKGFETSFDFFNSKGDQFLNKKGIEGFIGGGSDANNYRGTPVLTNAVVDANGFATSGTINNFKAVIRNHNEGAKDELNSFGWNTKVETGDWTSTLDLGRSKVTRSSERYETTAGLPGNCTKPGYACDTISWTGFTGGNTSGAVQYKTGLNYSDPNVAKLTDVMGWGGGEATPQAGYIAAPNLSDQVDTARLATKRNVEFGPVGAIELGMNLTTRSKISNTDEGFLVINGVTGPYASVTAPGAGVTSVGGIPIMTWNPSGSLGSTYSLRPNLYGTVINRNWSVSERVTTSFVKADLDGSLFGLAYTGNVGTQVVNTDQRSTGFNTDSAACTGTTSSSCKGVVDGTSFVDVLPSLNLAFEAGADQVVRLGIGKVISRPKMGDMRTNTTFGVNSSLPTPILVGSGGNAKLEPFRATAYDISFEKYFGKQGYVSVAGFYKDMSTYILTLGQQFDFKNYVTPSTVLPPNKSTQGILNAPFNGSGGTIQGIELSASLPLSMIAKPLDGFGVSINHSDTSSSIKIPIANLTNTSATTLDIPLPGLSRQVTNLRFFYEKNGVQVAIANRRRSDYIGEVVDYKDDRELTYIKAESVVDLQLGYEFQTGMFKGLSLLFQANNVNNEPFVTYTSDPELGKKTVYGKTYLFGLNYKM